MSEFNILVIIGGVFGLIMGGGLLYQLSSIAFATAETQESTAKAVLLLTVLANRGGATQDDINNALGKGAAPKA